MREEEEKRKRRVREKLPEMETHRSGSNSQGQWLGWLQLHAAEAQQETASCALPFLFRSSSFPFFTCCCCCCRRLFLLKIVSPSWFSTNILWPSPSISHDSSGEATRDATSWLRPCKKETRQPREKQTQPKIIIKTNTKRAKGQDYFFFFYYFVWLENASEWMASVRNWRSFLFSWFRI